MTLCLIGRGCVAVDGNLGMHNVKTSGGTYKLVKMFDGMFELGIT